MEKYVVENLNTQLDKAKYLPFLITKEFIFWKKGVPELRRKTVFLGYVFVKTQCEPKTVINDFKPIISNFGNKIIRILNYGDSNDDIMLRASEQALWMSLVDSDFCIRASEVVYKADVLNVVSGSLLGKENLIKQVNRYKRKVFIDVEFAGELVEVSIAIKVLKE